MITNTISAIGEITQEDLDKKQNVLIAGTNITIDEITITISSTSDITQTDLDFKTRCINSR